MSASMYLTCLLLIFPMMPAEFVYVKVFNSENVENIQSYDCIYYKSVTAANNETTPYCIRTKESGLLNRSFSSRTCANSGQEWIFKSLKERNVSQDEILKWRSSIELVDRYAAYITTGNEQYANEKICNCSLGTFGKFCEYKFMTMNSFEETIAYQFDLKRRYRHGSQLWGNITCYTTFTNCYSGLRCLSWQNICDGEQQCMDGIDEDHCEELEFNECEENEYRCHDGSCISEDYWLDGAYDCSDKSDEQQVNDYMEDSQQCPLTSSQFNCDEVTTYYADFACGDGQFVSNSIYMSTECYNYRRNMFFCEFIADQSQENNFWTLDNGHCVNESLLEKNFTNMNEQEKCVFYLKCNLTNGKNLGCEEAVHRFDSMCKGKRINYPSEPFFTPYVYTMYELNNIDYPKRPDYIYFNGSVKCVGYNAQIHSNETLLDWTSFSSHYGRDFSRFPCVFSQMKNASGLQFDGNCWNDTKHSFFCDESHRCISRYHVGNNHYDCAIGEDETTIHGCQKKHKHRLNCLGRRPMCLPVSEIGHNFAKCQDASDAYLQVLRWKLNDYKCSTSNILACTVLKAYIQSPSTLLTMKNIKTLLFRQYCDTMWQLPTGFDESLCADWICANDQYQCLSGHCIPIDYIINTDQRDWHCPDASDKLAFFKAMNLSKHNTRFINLFELNEIRNHLSQYITWFTGFSVYCKGEEYGCILADVDEPLNFTINRPCINLTQVGDGIIDCYGGLDERNTISCGNNTYQQRGFDFHCNAQECIPYNQQCVRRCSDKADSLLCDKIPALRIPSCRDRPRSKICTGFAQVTCQLTEIHSYYCDDERQNSGIVSDPYRKTSWSKQNTWIYLPVYPTLQSITPVDDVQTQQDQKATIYLPVIPPKEENDGEEGWICGRGVATKGIAENDVQCFCPPSLYGKYCQYFSDRITVITSLHDIPSEISEYSTDAIKVLTVLLSNGEVLDHHIFHLSLVYTGDLNKKFRFNLIHQRPKDVSKSYSIRFEAYHLTVSSSIQFLGVWEYPIHFSFLPSYRLAQILRFEKQNKSFVRLHICQTNNPCLHDSICHPIMNRIDNSSAYYCHCSTHSSGRDCQSKQLSSLICSKNALLRSFSPTKSVCLCPIHSYGPTCYIKHTCAHSNPCGINRGHCYPNPDDFIRDYICVCNKKFFGDHCQFDSAVVRMNFIDYSFIQSPSNFVMSSIIQLCDLDNETLDLMIREKRVYQGAPPPLTEIYHNNHYLPTVGILKLYHKQHPSNDYVTNLKQPKYFILYIVPFNVARLNLTSPINKANYCPYTSTVFHRNFSDISSLSQLSEANADHTFNASIMIFKYHLLCNPLYSLRCFQDDIYFCLCDVYGHAECSRHDLTLDECGTKCRVNGQCIRGDLDNRKDFICLCPRCYYGSICQHNTELFSFTLETLLTNDLYSSSVFIQRFFSSLLIIIPIILFLIGVVNNLFCYVTFNRKKPLLVGIGHYLRTVSIVNQVALLILLLKLMHSVLSIKSYIVHPFINMILCKMLSYLLSCATRMSYWLMGMVAIERVYVTWYLQGTWLKNPRIAKRIIITVILGIIILNIHEAIYYQSIDDPKSLDTSNSTWCVTSYPEIIAKYNQINIILNYVLPFLINLLSTIFLMILIVRKRASTVSKKSDALITTADIRSTLHSYIVLLHENKELILAPLITMLPQLFSLPQFILSFTLACQEFNINWQRYLLIGSYFITYSPQVFSYNLYVSPSTFYKREFHATKLGKMTMEWHTVVVTDKSEATAATIFPRA